MSVAKIGTKIGTEQIVKAFSKILSEKEANDMTKTMAEELWVGGEVKASRNMVLAFLRGKFGEVPKDIEEAVCQMNDPIALESLAARTGNCKTLDEFVAEL